MSHPPSLLCFELDGPTLSRCCGQPLLGVEGCSQHLETRRFFHVGTCNQWNSLVARSHHSRCLVRQWFFYLCWGGDGEQLLPRSNVCTMVHTVCAWPGVFPNLPWWVLVGLWGALIVGTFRSVLPLLSSRYSSTFSFNSSYFSANFSASAFGPPHLQLHPLCCPRQHQAHVLLGLGHLHWHQLLDLRYSPPLFSQSLRACLPAKTHIRFGNCLFSCRSHLCV